MIDKRGLFRQASEFTGFHKKLGVLIEPYLHEDWTMADVGCGLALIDFQLVNSVKSITAIDIDESALAEVERHIDEELAANRREAARIVTLRRDAAELADERWDVVLSSFFADSPETVGGVLALAERVGVIIMHGQERGGIFEPVRAGEMKMTARDVEAYLESRGYGYRKNVVDLQFGQPFRTIEAIHEFLSDKAAERHEAGRMTADMESAGPDEDEEGEGETDLDLLISSAEERIIKTKRYDYPYYLPRNLNTAVFIVGTRR